jgi:hypothetical protein
MRRERVNREMERDCIISYPRHFIAVLVRRLLVRSVRSARPLFHGTDLRARRNPTL